MNRQTAYNLIAALVVVLTLGLLSACGSVSVKTSPDGTMEVSTRTLWKDIEAASAQTEDMVLELGRSTSADEARTLMAMCLLFPQMEGCN